MIDLATFSSSVLPSGGRVLGVKLSTYRVTLSLTDLVGRLIDATSLPLLPEQLERVAGKIPEALINLGIAYERKGQPVVERNLDPLVESFRPIAATFFPISASRFSSSANGSSSPPTMIRPSAVVRR